MLGLSVRFDPLTTQLAITSWIIAFAVTIGVLDPLQAVLLTVFDGGRAWTKGYKPNEVPYRPEEHRGREWLPDMSTMPAHLRGPRG